LKNRNARRKAIRQYCLGAVGITLQWIDYLRVIDEEFDFKELEL
jgi:hypothetical protein